MQTTETVWIKMAQSVQNHLFETGDQHFLHSLNFLHPSQVNGPIRSKAPNKYLTFGVNFEIFWEILDSCRCQAFPWTSVPSTFVVSFPRAIPLVKTPFTLDPGQHPLLSFWTQSPYPFFLCIWLPPEVLRCNLCLDLSIICHCFPENTHKYWPSLWVQSLSWNLLFCT